MGKRHLASAVLLVVSTLLFGCFEIEQAIVLDEDLSGTAALDMTIDLEPMAVMMAQMTKAFAGEEGEPTPAEIEAAKQEMVASQSTEGGPGFDSDEIRSSLPEGVELLEAEVEEQGLAMLAHLRFAFDHVSKLSELDLATGQAAGDGGMGAESVEQPFAGLSFVDEGDTMVIRSPTLDPVEDLHGDDAGGGGESMGMGVEELLAGLRVAFTITLPFEVVEHNAMRREGQTLVWEYTPETLEAMRGSEAPDEAIFVRFAK